MKVVLKKIPQVVDIPKKGKGVATKAYFKGDFVCEYEGELILNKEAMKRERSFAEKEDYRSYMYYSTLKNKKYFGM